MEDRGTEESFRDMTQTMFLQPDQRYDFFLRGKQHRTPEIGNRLAPEQIHPLLFPFQRDITRWAIRKGRAAVLADCGLGKTIIQLEWARHSGKRVLILCPLSVAQQTIAEGKKIGVTVRFCERPVEEDGLWITNYQKLKHFIGAEYDAIVLDECFPPDTPIDTPEGRKYIKDIRPGEKIFNASGVDRVSDVHRRVVQYAVKIHIAGEEIISSPNHPYFTQRGWVGAQDLEPGDCLLKSTSAMRMVWGYFFSQEIGVMENPVLRDILFSEMANVAPRTQGQGSYERDARQDREESFGMVTLGPSESKSQCREDTQSQPHEGLSGEEESLPRIESHAPQTFRAWGKWDRIDGPAEDLAGCSRTRMESGTFFVSGKTNTWLSDALQARLSESRSQSRYRGGWKLPLREEREGHEEGLQGHFVRVESLEVLEQGHPDLEKYRDADGSLYFYDLGATMHPSFSVNGFLVHNSSILKSLNGKTRDILIKQFSHIPRRLCCTATPSPNDLAELANHAEFLGVMTRAEMLAHFFVHDAGGPKATGAWRLKGHGQEAFWKWVASWAVYVRSPYDLGYPDDHFQLPPFWIQEDKVRSVYIPEGELFPRMEGGISGRSKARRATLDDRIARAADVINAKQEQWVVWCNLNDEGQNLHKMLPDSVLIEGATPDDLRIEYEQGWRRGDARVLITKPQQYGHGLNWQHCHNVLYLGLSDSFEQYYQSVRRCWRFGQKETVNVVIVTSTAEYAIVQNIKRKEQQAAQLAAGIVNHMKDAMIEEIQQQDDMRDTYAKGEARGKRWNLLLGDSCERIKELADDSVGLSVFSPPFASLYTYSPLSRDMGNSKDYDEFFTHFRFLIPELLRVTLPGRRACVHVQQVTTTKVSHGVIGWRDFRADVVRHFVMAGWVYDGEVVIDKDPQAQAIRTKSKALMFVQKNKDSAWSRPAMADYILLFRKDGENNQPIIPDVSNEEWIMWARPIWYGIKESGTLNAAEARENNDEKHICPLQLETIERCIRLWSNPNEFVLDPFAGIGSTGYEAVRLGRQFIGCELKEAYWKVAQRNLRQSESLQTNLLL